MVISLRYSSSAATNAIAGSTGCQPLTKWGWSVATVPAAKIRARSPLSGNPFGPFHPPRWPIVPAVPGASR